MITVSTDPGRFLDAHRTALAEAIVARQFEQHPEVAERYGEDGRAKRVEDTEHTLSFLAVAVTYASPSLFSDYVAWMRPLLASSGFNREQVDARLRLMGEALRELLPEQMRESVCSFFDAAVEAAGEVANASQPLPASDAVVGDLATRYLHALLRTSRQEAMRLILDAVDRGVSVRDIYLNVFQPAQKEVGRLWQTGAITVAQEHFCTAATQLIMAQLYPRLFAQQRSDRRLIAVSVEGDLHEMGLRIVTDLFQTAGWDTIYLGANVPTDSVVQSIATHRPAVVLVSVTMAYHLPTVERLIRRIHSEVSEDTKVIVGGYPCNVEVSLWQRLGADGFACDADEAIELADRLIASDAQPQKPAAEPYQVTEKQERTGSTSSGTHAVYEELSRLNNELVTAHRDLARTNAELVGLQSELIAVDRRKNEFIATLAHELRNPLVPIRTGLQLLQRSRDDNALVDDLLDVMERQTRNIVRIVDDLLDLSRIGGGKMTLRRSTVELAPILKDAVSAVQWQIDEAKHDLAVRIPDETVYLDADSTRLAQIVTNLLANAARYTEPGGSITLSAQKSGSHVIIAVKDTGIGIPTDELDRIFDMFRQSKEGHSRSAGGLGIGLTLVKRLTEMHGGTVKARSEGPGKGSEFVVTLPVLDRPPSDSHRGLQQRVQQQPRAERD